MILMNRNSRLLTTAALTVSLASFAGCSTISNIAHLHRKGDTTPVEETTSSKLVEQDIVTVTQSDVDNAYKRGVEDGKTDKIMLECLKIADHNSSVDDVESCTEIGKIRAGEETTQYYHERRAKPTNKRTSKHSNYEEEEGDNTVRTGIEVPKTADRSNPIGPNMGAKSNDHKKSDAKGSRLEKWDEKNPFESMKVYSGDK
jgi:hypothetical protein